MKKLALLLVGLVSFCSIDSASASEAFSKCEKSFVKKQSYFIDESLCDSKGNLRQLTRYFASKPGQASEIWQLTETQSVLRHQTFNAEGERTQDLAYSPQADGTSITLVNNRPHIRYRIELFPTLRSEKIEAWYYRNGKLSFSEHYENTTLEGFPRRMTVFDEQERPVWTYDFKFRKSLKGVEVIESFKLYGSDRKKIGSYKENEVVLPDHSFGDRIPVVVIDSGFDPHHPDLKPYFSKRFRGEYSDIAVDRVGSAAVVDTLMLSSTRKPAFPFSHGTHVASLAFRGTRMFELVGFAGDYSDAEFLGRISRFIQEQRVPFVNMSFGFGSRDNPFGVNEASRFALVQLMRENPETLFFIAAGNDTLEVDQNDHNDLPASAPVENKIVVASSEQTEFSNKNLSRVRLAPHSNFGTKEVDFAAPGEDVLGALIGGAHVAMSGTSMATPLTLNVAMKVFEINPTLSPRQIQQILRESVVIPNQALPVKTGGVLNPELAYQKARALLR